MHRIGVLFLLVLFATGTVAADGQPKSFPDEATLRQRLSIDPHSKLVLRGRDGSAIGIKAFLDVANAPGGDFTFIPDPGSGIVTLTLSKPPSKPLNKWGDLVIGDPLPTFTLPSSEGRTIRSNHFDHDLTVVNFFSTNALAASPRFLHSMRSTRRIRRSARWG